MHNSYGTGDVEIRMGVGVAGPIPADGQAATIAGHDATYRRIDPRQDEWTVELTGYETARIATWGEEWTVNIDGTTVAIHLTAVEGTSQADLDDAHSIIDSMRYQPRDMTYRWLDTPFGFSLVFVLTTYDWDSG